MLRAAESAAVTNWPLRLLLVGIMLAVLVGVFYLMKRRWNRLKRDSEATLLPLTTNAPSGFVADISVEGLFIGTSPQGDWVRRVMAQGLGVRSRAQLQWGSMGIYIERVGETSFFIPRAHILDAQFGRGVAGTVRAKDSVLVFRWMLGDAVLDSGFRADTSEGHQQLTEIISSIHPVETGVPRTP